MKKLLISQYHFSHIKIAVIPPLVEKRQLSKNIKDDYFLCFGYLTRRKGIENVINGFANFLQNHPQYRLIIAGGTIRGQIKAKEEIVNLINKKSLTRSIMLKGFIKEKDFPKYFAKARAVLLPAKLSIASSGPLDHSLSFHKCILASNIGHFCQDIKNGENGILVENDGWAKALEKVVNDTKLVKKIEQGAKKRAAYKNPQKTANLYYRVYKKLTHAA